MNSPRAIQEQKRNERNEERASSRNPQSKNKHGHTPVKAFRLLFTHIHTPYERTERETSTSNIQHMTRQNRMSRTPYATS